MTTSASATIRAQSYGTSSGEYSQRLGRVRERLSERRLDAIILFYPPRVSYLTGYSHAFTERPMALVVPTDGEPGVLVPLLEQEHARKVPQVEHVKAYPEYPTGDSGKHPIGHLAALLTEMGLRGKPIAADGDGYADVNGYVGPSVSQVMDSQVVVAPEIVDKLRQVKSAAECALIRESAVWGNLAHRLLQDAMAAGRSEIEISLLATTEATRSMLKALGCAYAGHGRVVRNAPVVAQFISRANTERRERSGQGLMPGDAVMTFATANVGGYRSELERTMIVGEPSPEFRRYFDAMLALQRKALAAFRPGRTCAEVEREMVGAAEDLGVKELTRHHTGHGIGLEGHEQPFCDLGDETVIEPGMVFSVEPGLYVPGLAGFRHSDTIIVAEDGCELVTFYPRDLDSLIVPA